LTLILFDLDDTLLGNEMDTFIPAYLQSLAKRMAAVADPAELIKTLLMATRQMVENIDPSHTLEDRFDATFYPALGLLRQDVQGIIDSFYEIDFPRLKGLTQFLPNSVKAVEQLLQRGDQAAIATNPLFPSTAILQRLKWAGFPDAQELFRLIPSYDTFHFAKPNPAFFAEFLAQLGWPTTPVVMVGNDINMDINAACQLGMPVFWISNGEASKWCGEGDIPPHGEITDLIPWLESASPQRIQKYLITPSALLAVLRSTPAALSTIYRQQNSNCDRRTELPGRCLDESIRHLRDMDKQSNLLNLQKTDFDQRPTLQYEHIKITSNIGEHSQEDGFLALEEFTKTRVEILQFLESLPLDRWEGSRQETFSDSIQLRDMVNRIAEHDIFHIQHVFKFIESIK
jgi:FMN phosphatase YigB (HAD superfamily)